MTPRVLMVTGAYYPELSGGGLQARAVVQALKDQAAFAVLTTSIDSSLPAVATEDGVPIRRIYVNVNSVSSRVLAGARFVAAFLRLMPRIDVVNLHGFSRKAILLRLLCALFGKRFVLTLQTGGQDEPAAARALGREAYWAFAGADLYLSVSPGLSQAFVRSGLPESRLRQVCNAVDVDRFAPASATERTALRSELRLPPDVPVVLFVGYFSRDKRPDLLYRAWARSSASAHSMLVFVGATRASYKEVDPALAGEIRAEAASAGLADRLVFVEATRTIERYFRAADLYVLPSIREGLPIALIEAMAAALPCVATRLPGATDVLLEDGVSGRLVTPDDEQGFAAAIDELIADRAEAARLGTAARETAVQRFSIRQTAGAWLAAYREAAALR